MADSRANRECWNMNSDQCTLLQKILEASLSGSGSVNAQRFRAQHYLCLKDLDELEQKRYIENTDGRYTVKLRALSELDKEQADANDILSLCELVFKVLHKIYLERPGEAVSLENLAKEADISRSDVNKVVPYLMQSTILGGWTTLFEDEAATLSPSEQVLRYNSFKEIVQKHAEMEDSFFVPVEHQSSALSVNPFYGHDYICQIRIADIEKLKSSKFDFVRLVQICKEINSNARSSNYFALGALLRMLLDHIPPIFGFNTFKEVAANYRAGKSLRASLRNLENSSRNISDGLLHQTIRKREVLPSLNQVNFSPDIDVLLAEIILVMSGK